MNRHLQNDVIQNGTDSRNELCIKKQGEKNAMKKRTKKAMSLLLVAALTA